MLIEPAMLADLARAGWVRPDSAISLARIGMGLFARADAPTAETGSVAAFERTLLQARSIAYTADGHSGMVFLRTLERLGMREKLGAKLVPVSGRLATEAVTDGSAQYVAFPLWKPAPALRLIGAFPVEAQTYIGVAGAIGARSSTTETAGAFLRHLRSEPARAVFREQGFEWMAEK